MTYDVNFFIGKFQEIPESKWTVGAYHNESRTAACASGHCDAGSEEWHSLYKLFIRVFDCAACYINDGKHERYQQPTPKQRILAALYDIRAMQQKDIELVEPVSVPIPEPKEKIKYVSVPDTLKEKTKELYQFEANN